MGLVSTIAVYVPVVLLFLLLKKLVSIFLKRRNLQEAFKEFPGPRPHLLWGNTRELPGNYNGLLRMADLSHTYPGVYPVWTGPCDAQLVAVGPDTTKAILSGSDPKDEFSYSLMRPWIGDGLLLSKDRKWDRNRRLMTPAFHMDILKNYVKVFSDCTTVLAKKWRMSSTSEEVFHHISLLTLDSMMQCLFGYHSDCQNERTRHPYIQGVYDVSELIVKRVINPLHHYDFYYYNFTENGKKFQQACDAIHHHSKLIIEQRKLLLQTEPAGHRTVDFLDILLTAKDSTGQGLSDQEIQDEVDTFMFEGHDSTASTISWCLYNLALNPECQQRCREEIHSVVGQTGKITWETLNRLEYVTMCINESMLLYPPVPTVYTACNLRLPRIFALQRIKSLRYFRAAAQERKWPQTNENENSQRVQAVMETLNKLEYVTMCINESMRLYPAVPTISRCLARDIALDDGRVIPAGVRVAVSLFAVQRDPEIWNNPTEFQPERFAPEKKVSSKYHLPFSIGPRNCIGQQFALTQVKVVLCEILRSVRLEPDPSHEAQPECLLILRSLNGLYLNIKPL